jgi:hypothetical protein
LYIHYILSYAVQDQVHLLDIFKYEYKTHEIKYI